MLVVPHLIIRHSGKILLLKRASGQKFWVDHWHCVAGTIEKGESPQEAIIREAREEVGLVLKDVSLVTTIALTEKDWLDPTKKFYALELFFLAELHSNQTPVNMEPLKQSEMNWFLPTDLPSPMIPGVKFGILSFLNGVNYGEFRNA